MLVDDVPKVGPLEHVEGVRNLECDDRIRTGAQRPPKAREKRVGGLDVLEKLPRDHKIRTQVDMGFVVELLAEGQALVTGRVGVFLVAGIEPDTAVVAKLDQHLEERALAAADLEHELLSQAVPIDEPGREITRVVGKEGRVIERCLVRLVVVKELGIKGGIEQQPARSAKRKSDIAFGARSRLVSAIPDRAAQHRNAFDPMKGERVSGTASRALRHGRSRCVQLNRCVRRIHQIRGPAFGSVALAERARNHGARQSQPSGSGMSST